LRRTVEHFADQSWADFVRGVGPAETLNSIASHLDAGCPDCVATRSFWDRVRITTANEAEYAVPEQLLRRLELEFTTRHSATSATPLAAIVFDSFSRPLPVGVRAGAVGPRQLVYEAEGLTVDLRVERDVQSKKICAVGQVLDKRSPQPSPSSGTVILWTSQGYPVIEATPNAQGEFQLEFEAQDQLRLSIEMAGRTPFRIALPELKAGFGL
jgi:hypothetical protein